MADRAWESFVAASQLGGTVADHADAFLHGMHAAMLVGSDAALAAAVAMTLLLPAARVRRALGSAGCRSRCGRTGCSPPRSADHGVPPEQGTAG